MLKQLGKLFLNAAVKMLARPVISQVRHFDRLTLDPRRVQEDVLRRILRYHRDTAFGREHGFAAARSVEDFRRSVPVAGYDYFEPYLERVRRGEVNALLADRRVLMFALTSGTTAKRKTIPVTAQYLADYKRTWNFWGLRAFRDHTEIRLRPIVQISGDWEEGHTESGVPCGAVTGLTAKMQKRVIRWLYTVPAAVAKVKDPLAKHYLVLRLSVPRRPGMVVAANPSTLVNLARVGDREKESLIRDIHDGTLDPRFDVPAPVREALTGRLRKKRPAKAKELDEVVRQTGTLLPKDYWPKTCLIGTWMGGSVGAYVRHLPKYYGEMPVRDPGLIASEGRMTIPFEDGTPSGVLDVQSHYFEFIPEGEAESDRPVVLGAHELEEGRRYFILLTTAYGLYRYHIYDLVRCTGFFNGTPKVEFLSKGSHFANITGEKLSEYQVVQAVREAAEELGLPLGTYSLAPCWDEELPFYGLFVERGDFGGECARLAEAVERRLAALNIEYAAKRESLRLGAVRPQLLPAGTWQQWDRQRLAKSGGTAEQYKHPCLIADLNFRATVPVEADGPATATVS